MNAYQFFHVSKWKHSLFLFIIVMKLGGKYKQGLGLLGTPPVTHCKSNWQEIDETVLRWPLKCHRYTECTLSDHFSMYTHKSICGTIEMASSNKRNNGLGGWRQRTYCTVRSVSTVSLSFHFLLSLPTLFLKLYFVFSLSSSVCWPSDI